MFGFVASFFVDLDMYLQIAGTGYFYYAFSPGDGVVGPSGRLYNPNGVMSDGANGAFIVSACCVMRDGVVGSSG